jgi:hypothetical protein
MKPSDNPYPYVTLVPAAAPGSPAAGLQRLYLDSGNSNKLSRKDSSGSATVVESAGGTGASTSAVRATTASSQSFTSGTEAAITWEAEDFDDATYHDLVTNNSRFTAPATGRYRLTFGYGLLATKIAFFSVRKNGTTQMSRIAAVSLSGFSANGQCLGGVTSGPLALTASDYLEATALHFTVAGTGTTTRDSSVASWATFERIT